MSKEDCRVYYAANSERIKAQKKAYRAKNKVRLVHSRQFYLEQNAFAVTERSRIYSAQPDVKLARSERDKERYASDPNFKLGLRVRNRLLQALKYFDSTGKGSISLLGCSIGQLKLHLELQFLPGMTWENHGRKGWHIDHRVPFASIDLSVPSELERVCHFSNLQPLWWKDNLSKGGK